MASQQADQTSPFNPRLSILEDTPWIVTNSRDEPGFPYLLRTIMILLGINHLPRYVGKEFHTSNHVHCVVSVHINTSPDYPTQLPFSVTAVGHRFADTIQAVSRKALKLLCDFYEAPLANSIMRYFPFVNKNLPQWKSRMATLAELESTGQDPTLVITAKYLHTLDDLCDQQTLRLESRTQREEEAEARCEALRLQLEKADARAAKAERNLAAAVTVLSKMAALPVGKTPYEAAKFNEHILQSIANSADPYHALYQIFYQEQALQDIPGTSDYQS